eukprot:sb/3475528/
MLCGMNYATYAMMVYWHYKRAQSEMNIRSHKDEGCIYVIGFTPSNLRVGLECAIILTAPWLATLKLQRFLKTPTMRLPGVMGGPGLIVGVLLTLRTGPSIAKGNSPGRSIVARFQEPTESGTTVP